MPPVPSFRSSGNLLVDRRYEYARAAFDEGDFTAAADLARQALELVPGFAAALALLGRAEAARGNRKSAVEALQGALAIEPDDALGVRLVLARLGALEPGAAITDGYVRALFDDYAPQFERHLVKNLLYCGPDLLADAIRRASHQRLKGHRFRRVFDLGCGTGLMARALEGVAPAIEGVDLSPRMLAKAAKTHLYEALHEGELVAFLKGRASGEADLVVAADVFAYMADLSAVFAEAHRVLEREGLFAFTVQAHEGDGVMLGEDARFAHGEGYLADIASETGFKPAVFERVSTREDRGEPVPGFLMVLER